MRAGRAVLSALLLAALLAGCRGPGGRVTALGSSSMDYVMGILAEQYGLDHPDVVVSVEGGGSSAGVEAAITGDAHIGLSSRRLKGAERERGLVETIVALDGIAVIVSADNPVDNLTMEQLADVYTGAVTNWAQVGGADVPIAPVGREAGSGTRDGFEQATGTQGRCALTQELISTGAVVEAVRGNAAGGAAGDLPLAPLGGVRALPGVELPCDHRRGGVHGGGGAGRQLSCPAALRAAHTAGGADGAGPVVFQLGGVPTGGGAHPPGGGGAHGAGGERGI